ncbi:MAG: hypothetical protein JSW02_03070 [candidate division WOR-3 bacterium]|nr:MAG: hypothetical protein JSW02_03070 [candidate division WOR-3 bacterium]
MRKIIITLILASILPTSFAAHALEFHKNKKTITQLDEKTECYQNSYWAISDSVLESWTRIFVQEGIDGNPFAMTIYLIEHFSRMRQVRDDKCLVLDEISSSGQTNLQSSVIATCALMRKMGWDLQLFYNDDEIYLGIYFSDVWEIRGGHVVESDGRTYYLKEFDTNSPVGMLNKKTKGHFHRCYDAVELVLEPLPLVQSLPWFDGEYHERKLKWEYQDKSYTYSMRIPEKQVQWTQNIPLSLYGMAASGILELQNTGLPDHLQRLIHGLNEYERVNFLLKFCQSEGVFRYKKDEPIKSVSEQLQKGRNDCDGRSVFLYSLLRSVMDYTDDDIVFALWPDQLHLALSLRPRTAEAIEILGSKGYSTGNGFYILDATYEGETYWGSKMDVLSGKMEIITR